MQDSVLVVALEEARALVTNLGGGTLARDLRRRIDAVDAAVSRTRSEDGELTGASLPKDLIVRLALHALALRDEAARLATERGSARAAVVEMMD